MNKIEVWIPNTYNISLKDQTDSVELIIEDTLTECPYCDREVESPSVEIRITIPKEELKKLLERI